MRANQRTARTAAAVAVGTLTLTGAFAAGAVWSGGTGAVDQRSGRVDPTAPGSTVPEQGSPFRLVSQQLRPARDCAELLDHYIEGNLDRVGPYGWGWGPVVLDAATSSVGSGSPAAAAEAAPGLRGQAASSTGTNVQEVGVDEPDLAKTDGALLVRIADGQLTTYDVTGQAPRRLGGLALPPGLEGAELLLVGDRVVVVGTEWRTGGDSRWDLWWGGDPWSEQTTHALEVDVSDPATPALVGERSWDARLVTARQHGTVVRLVLGSSLPQLDFVTPGPLRDEREATERNREILRASTIEDWLPSVTTAGASTADGTEPIADCADIALPDEAPADGGVYVVAFDAAQDPGSATRAVGLATATELAYVSDDRLYLATGGFGGVVPAFPEGPVCCIDVAPGVPGAGVPGVEVPGVEVPGVEVPGAGDWGRTSLHSFALDGTATTYTASGTVDGVIADRWSMDEQDDVLRVAVGPSPATGNYNSVLTLAERGDELVQLGSVDRLGVNETIQSMRWYDDLAVMVTFRQVDPLYAIDLSDPERPRALGKLKIPGFSSYLHPLDSRWLLGMGQAADGSAQAALFDLRDLSQPVRTDWLSYRKGSYAAAGDDPRQFTWLPGRRTALTVVTEGWTGRTGWVSVLTVRGGELTNRMVPADVGDDVTRIRTVPLPGPLASGRVVLVTDDEVSFLPL